MPNREILMGLSFLTGNRCGLPVNLLLRMDEINVYFVDVNANFVLKCQMEIKTHFLANDLKL